jgi:hypothetical protein
VCLGELHHLQCEGQAISPRTGTETPTDLLEEQMPKGLEDAKAKSQTRTTGKEELIA